MPPTTPSQTVGPYYAIGLCRRPDNELVPPDAPGALRLAGRLLDGAGDPVDGMIEAWDHANGRWGKPPPAGEDAPRLDVWVFARGLLKHQLTRVYFPDEPEANAADPVLASLPEADRAVLVAAADGDGLRWDIRLQGEGAAVFFAV
jgi:protocatechuate 3,4-dioxygenase alpha subunit